MEIPKSNLHEFLEKNTGYKILKRREDTIIIQLPDGELLKILNDALLEMIADTGFDLEERLEEIPNLTDFNHFALPTRRTKRSSKFLYNALYSRSRLYRLLRKYI